jgi:hypothetical protein
MVESQNNLIRGDIRDAAMEYITPHNITYGSTSGNAVCYGCIWRLYLENWNTDQEFLLRDRQPKAKRLATGGGVGGWEAPRL